MDPQAAAEHGSAVARETVRLGLAGRDPVRLAFQEWFVERRQGAGEPHFARRLLARGLINEVGCARLEESLPLGGAIPEHLRPTESSQTFKIPPDLRPRAVTPPEPGATQASQSSQVLKLPAQLTSAAAQQPAGESTLEFKAVLPPAPPPTTTPREEGSGLGSLGGPPKRTVEFRAVLPTELEATGLEGGGEPTAEELEALGRTVEFEGVLRPAGGGAPIPPPTPAAPAAPYQPQEPPLGLRSEELTPSGVLQLIDSTADSSSSLPDASALIPEARHAVVFAADPDEAAEAIDSEEAGPPRRDLEPPRPGDVVGGHALIKVLGRGGMGVIYLATRQAGGQQVALKALVGGDDPGADRRRQRFRREFEALRRLDHPHIVSVHDYGRQGAIDWYTMDFVEGTDLEQLLLQGALEPHERLDVFEEVCQAVAHAHERQVVHRDLKPQNVLVDGRGKARVVDFGLAKILDQGIGMTRTGSALGTPFYMAPEQLRSAKEVDARADVFALGVMLFELVTGKRPFDGETAAEVGNKILTEDPPRPTQVKKSLHPDLDGICLKALEKEPERRYPDAAALLGDVRRHRKGQGVARERGWRGSLAAARRWSARNRAALVGGVLATAITGPVAAYFALRGGGAGGTGGAVSALGPDVPAPDPHVEPPAEEPPPKEPPPKEPPPKEPPPKEPPPKEPPPKEPPPKEPPPKEPPPKEPPPKEPPAQPPPKDPSGPGEEPYQARTPEELMRLGLRPPEEPADAGVAEVGRVHAAPEDQQRLVLALGAHVAPALARGDLGAALRGLQLLRREGILLADAFAKELERDMETLSRLRELLALRLSASGLARLRLDLHGCGGNLPRLDTARVEALPGGFLRLGQPEAWVVLDPLLLDMNTLRAAVRAGPGERLDPAGPGYALAVLGLWRGLSEPEIDPDLGLAGVGPAVDHRRATAVWLPRAREAAWRALEDQAEAALRAPVRRKPGPDALAAALGPWRGPLALTRVWQTRRKEVLEGLPALIELDGLWPGKLRSGEQHTAWTAADALPPGWELAPARDDPKSPRPFRAEVLQGALRLENGRLEAPLLDLLPSTASLQVAAPGGGPLLFALGDVSSELEEGGWVARAKGAELARDQKKRSLSRPRRLEIDRRGEGEQEERLLRVNSELQAFSAARAPLAPRGQKSGPLALEAVGALRVNEVGLTWRPAENEKGGAALVRHLLDLKVMEAEAEAALGSGERSWALDPAHPAGLLLSGSWEPGEALAGWGGASCLFLPLAEAGLLRLRLAWDDGPGVRLEVRQNPGSRPTTDWLLPGLETPDLERWREVEVRFHPGGRVAQVRVDGLPLRCARERELPGAGGWCFGLVGVDRTRLRLGGAELVRLGPPP